MAEPDRPRSPFAGMADLSARTPVRVLSPDEIERQLAEHRPYLEAEYHPGHRANDRATSWLPKKALFQRSKMDCYFFWGGTGMPGILTLTAPRWLRLVK
jgi:hypothetical protein